MDQIQRIDFDRIRTLLASCRQPDCLEIALAQIQEQGHSDASPAPTPMSPEEAALRLLIDLQPSRTT